MDLMKVNYSACGKF